MKKNTINCPHCNEPINVDEVLAHTTEERIRKELNTAYSAKQKEVESQLQAIEAKEGAIKQQQKQLEIQAEEKVNELLRSERKQLELKLKKQFEAENEDAIELMKEELRAKSVQLKEFKKATAEIEKLKREKSEMREELAAEFEKQHSDQLKAERLKIQQDLERNLELKFKDKDHLIQQLRDQLKNAQKKAEQGSMQAQGEVQELAIEEFLRNAFPLDTIKEIGKGVMGGDCIQVVNTHFSQNCGKIYYESKRTKNFSNAWIEKFKQDMRNQGVDIGVIVTEAMPDDLPQMGLKDGIYICSFEEFKSLSHVLRHVVIELHSVTSAQENKGSKMEMLYSYLTSNEFKMQVEAIAEGFRHMQIDLEKEKAAMRRLWKKREKQIEKVAMNTLDMHGAIKGIAGNAIQDIKALELDEDYLLED